MKKRYCAFKGDGHYIDNVGNIIDEGQKYYVIEINKNYYYGGERLWVIKKKNVIMFDSPKLAKKWIKEQNYYYDDNYPDGIPPGIDKEKYLEELKTFVK